VKASSIFRNFSEILCGDATFWGVIMAEGVLSNSVGDRASSNAKSSSKSYVNLNLFLLGIVILTAIYVGLRLYQQAFGWSAGLDATSAEFQEYWMTLVKIEIPVLFSTCFIGWGYLWFSRDRSMGKMDAKTELRRHFTLVLWILTYTFTFYWTGSFFAEQDGVWHQTVIRDTSFTPSHNVLFYACIPIYMFFGVGGLLYGMTRVPQFSRGISIAYVFAVLGPAMILPNLGFNEWGHAYWLTEEIFSHPLHWGFVVLGWNALGIGGVLMQIVIRMVDLFKEIQIEDSETVIG
jgi:methane/ammonia monooxygenase subunit C